METNEILEELKIKYRTLTVEDKARLLNYVRKPRLRSV